MVWQVGQLGCVGAVGWGIAGKRCDKQVARKPLSDGRVAGGGVTDVLHTIDVTGMLRGVLGMVSNGEWRERGSLQVALFANTMGKLKIPNFGCDMLYALVGQMVGARGFA